MNYPAHDVPILDPDSTTLIGLDFDDVELRVMARVAQRCGPDGDGEPLPKDFC